MKCVIRILEARIEEIKAQEAIIRSDSIRGMSKTYKRSTAALKSVKSTIEACTEGIEKRVAIVRGGGTRGTTSKA